MWDCPSSVSVNHNTLAQLTAKSLDDQAMAQLIICHEASSPLFWPRKPFRIHDVSQKFVEVPGKGREPSVDNVGKTILFFMTIAGFEFFNRLSCK